MCRIHVCQKCSLYKTLIFHPENMPEIAETALANFQQEIKVRIGGCLTVVLSCDDVEAVPD